MNFNHYRLIFHRLNYVQYPLYVFAFYFAIKPYFNGIDHAIDNLDMLVADTNTFFILLGVGIAMSSLQDAQKTTFNFEKKVIDDPKLAQMLITITALCCACMILLGLIGYLFITHSHLHELSIGILVMGIGFIGVVKQQLDSVEVNLNKS